MIRFEKTIDFGLVRQILATPAAYRRMVDDSAPALGDFVAPSSERYLPILAIDEAGPCGAFLLFPTHPTAAEVHFCLLPRVWGYSQIISQQFIDWVWEETSLNRLIGPVPAHNRLAIKLAKSVGFSQVGIEQAAIQRHGKPCDRLILEMGRP